MPRPPLDLAYPFIGRWLVQNSPANRVPSHGTDLYATTYAIDFVPVEADGRTGPIDLRALFLREPPERFPGFGREAFAPIGGTVVAVHDTERDHEAHRGLRSMGYALTQRGRVGRGWLTLAGNHVMIETDSGAIVALCHLQQGSARTAPGDIVSTGDVIGSCGNSGNSTEPHVHLQAMTHHDPSGATAVPITFEGRLPRNHEVVEAD